MTSILPFFIIIASSLITFKSIAGAEDRAPHGIAYENPIDISPAAYQFFHPKSQETEIKKPIAVQLEATTAELENKAVAAAATEAGGEASPERRNRLGSGAVAGIVIGLACAVLLAMVASYVLTKTRKAKANIENTVQPEA